MTEAGWTREKPTVAGWYWWRHDENGAPQVILVAKDLWAKSMNQSEDFVDEIDGEWLGPITPDSCRQGRVAAFKEAEQRFNSLFGATDRRIDSVRDYRVDKFYTWLAQQAQEAQ